MRVERDRRLKATQENKQLHTLLENSKEIESELAKQLEIEQTSHQDTKKDVQYFSQSLGAERETHSLTQVAMKQISNFQNSNNDKKHFSSDFIIFLFIFQHFVCSFHSKTLSSTNFFRFLGKSIQLVSTQLDDEQNQVNNVMKQIEYEQYFQKMHNSYFLSTISMNFAHFSRYESMISHLKTQLAEEKREHEKTEKILEKLYMPADRILQIEESEIADIEILRQALKSERERHLTRQSVVDELRDQLEEEKREHQKTEEILKELYEPADKLLQIEEEEGKNLDTIQRALKIEKQRHLGTIDQLREENAQLKAKLQLQSVPHQNHKFLQEQYESQKAEILNLKEQLAEKQRLDEELSLQVESHLQTKSELEVKKKELKNEQDALAATKSFYHKEVQSHEDAVAETERVKVSLKKSKKIEC